MAFSVEMQIPAPKINGATLGRFHMYMCIVTEYAAPVELPR